MIKIKIAKEVDAKSISLLGRITFTETFGHLFNNKNDLIDYCNYTFSVQKIKDGLKKTNNIFWIATLDELPIGYAKLKLNSKSKFIKSKSTCQLQKIYVLNDFLTMKIGFKLQSILIEKAIKNQYKTIWLSVLKSNERAITFYKKNNFKKVGNHEFQIGKENFKFIAMSKTL